MSLNYIYNISHLVIVGLVGGVIFYNIFNMMEWWNPLFSGIIGGIIMSLMVLPSVFFRIKESENRYAKVEINETRVKK